MNRLPPPRLCFIATLLICEAASLGQAADWPKLLDHPPAGANTIALFNVEALKLGAAKLKRFKEGEQAAAAADLVAELPENSRRGTISAQFDFDSLEPIWEVVTVTYDKNPPNQKRLAERDGGYVDQIAGRPVVWSPRGRYYVPMGDDRLTVHIPANRPTVAHWIRGLGQAVQPLPEYLKRAADRALDGTAMLVAVDMADTISPVQAAEKVATLKSVSAAKLNPEALGKLLGDLHGITLSVSVKDQFMGELKLDFGTAPTLLRETGQAIVIEALARRGMLLAEMRDWTGNVDGKSFVLSGPLDAISIVNLLAFFKGSPSSSDAHHETSVTPNESSESDGTAKMAKASKRYFDGTQRILGECRNTKGLSVAERGVFNDKLSRKIDDLPLLNVDTDLLDFGATIAQLLRGAGVTIRSANVAAGGQKATQATSYRSVGYYGSSFSFNDNTAYNESLERQAHAQGMQAHLSNMEQVDTMTADIRRKMTQKYMIEF